MSKRTLILTIKMLSDWRIGQGKGARGGVMEMVQRDEDGFPYIPVSTMRGIWRDSAEQLAFVLDDGERDGKWSNVVDHVFGSQPAIDKRGKKGENPIKSLITLTRARMAPAVRQAVGSKKQLLDALVFRKPGIGIDFDSGAAKQDFLRFHEMARKGTSLASEVSLETDSNVLIAFLACAARMIESIGGDRRRGAGRCEVDIPDFDWDGAAETLKTAQAPQMLSEQNRDSEVSYGRPLQGDFRRYPVTINFLSPVIIAEEVLGNIVTTKSYIPGTMLLGPILKAMGGNLDSAVVCGDIRVLPAYPVVGRERTRPVPFCWTEKKDDTGKSLENSFVQEQAKDEVWKPLPPGYCVESDGVPSIAEVSRTTFTHNTVDDEMQTPRSDVGGVYTYEALGQGQVYAAELWIREGLDVSVPVGGAYEARVGRAVNAGYGHIELSIGGLSQNYSGSGVSVREDENPILYFSTDCILPAGISANDWLSDCLLQRGICTEVVCANIKVERHEGWMPSAGLPRQSFVCIKAGSVVVLDNCNSERLHEAVKYGLGARNAEGFGIVEVNPEIVSRKRETKGEAVHVDMVQAPEVVEELSVQDRLYLKQVEETALRKAIRRISEELAADEKWRMDKLGIESSKMTQLGNLKAVMGALNDERAIKTVNMWLDSRKTNQPEKLCALFKAPETVWELFEADFSFDGLLAVSDVVEVTSSDSDTTRYAILSILNAAVKAHSRKLENEAQHEEVV